MLTPPLGDYKLDPPDEPDPAALWEKFLAANYDELDNLFEAAEALVRGAQSWDLDASWTDFISLDMQCEISRWQALKNCAAQRKGAQAK